MNEIDDTEMSELTDTEISASSPISQTADSEIIKQLYKNQLKAQKEAKSIQKKYTLAMKQLKVFIIISRSFILFYFI